MRNFNVAGEIRPQKTFEQSTAEKAAIVFDLISRALYTSLQGGLVMEPKKAK